MSEPVKRARRGWLWALVVIPSVAILVLVVGLFSYALARAASGTRTSASHGQHGFGEDQYPTFKEVWAYGRGEAKVVNIPLTGTITLNEEQGMFGPVGGTAAVLRAIRRATHDTDVRAIILSIDSGGGGITASDILYNALRDFKDAQPNRVVVALFGDVAASGAYYVALAADHIVAHPTTITGSIGVLLQTLNLQGLGEKLGVKDVTIKSGENKDMLNPLHELTPEQRAMLQSLVDEMQDRFVALVVEGRKLPEDRVRQLADGRVFSAQRAIEAGLVDELGYWNDAVEKTAQLLGVPDVKVFRYEQTFSFSDLLKARAAVPPNPVAEALDNAQRPRLSYRWQL